MFQAYQPLFTSSVQLFRYGNKVLTRGIYVNAEPQPECVKATVQPMTDLENIKKLFGANVSAAILYTSSIENKLNIETETTSPDIIYWDDNFWKVQSTVIHKVVLNHTKSQATFMVHPPQELLDLTRYLVLEDGTEFRLNNNLRLIV